MSPASLLPSSLGSTVVIVPSGFLSTFIPTCDGFLKLDTFNCEPFTPAAKARNTYATHQTSVIRSSICCVAQSLKMFCLQLD
ncbi:hypothetical protein K435DRAFT_859567 [Dendrothele bispora CBS 962.96]|uniref:Uncharacterized protein n=1 Tax=Dendrothele bispora (strain CBS 962.96) TaxID=1314807 RepID=A0A4S8M0M1_DENBC|nr:hypothetical protein K435DRAFT_859567 [Dendrothele bispora CBS 962.96]